MKKMICEINNAWFSLGESIKKISKNELFVKKYRRSIYASNDIKKGEEFSDKNLKIIRPGNGLSPTKYHKIIGKKSKKNLKFGDPLTLKFI